MRRRSGRCGGALVDEVVEDLQTREVELLEARERPVIAARQALDRVANRLLVSGHDRREHRQSVDRPDLVVVEIDHRCACASTRNCS